MCAWFFFLFLVFFCVFFFLICPLCVCVCFVTLFSFCFFVFFLFTMTIKTFKEPEEDRLWLLEYFFVQLRQLHRHRVALSHAVTCSSPGLQVSTLPSKTLHSLRDIASTLSSRHWEQ